MRAAVFHEHGGPEVLQMEDLPKPDPGSGQVRIRVCAVGLNHLDLWARRGLPFAIPMPHVGGSDIAGWVDAVGSGVTGVEAGDRIVVDPSIGYGWYDVPHGAERAPPLEVIGEHTQGGLAEYCLVPAANLLAVPDGCSLTIAAAAGLNAVTAWHGLVGQGRLQPSEAVLVTGASGGVATMAIQLAKARGATVYAVTSGAENVRRAEALGADVVYDRIAVDPAREVWSATGKRGVDLVFDSVGGAMWEGNLRSLAPRGRLVVYGATTQPEVRIDLRRVFWRQLTITGTTMGPPEAFREVMGMVFAGTVQPVVDRILSLEETRMGHELLEAGDVFGKLVVRVAEEDGWS